jgi:putative heme-binding domain-containing protein
MGVLAFGRQQRRGSHGFPVCANRCKSLAPKGIDRRFANPYSRPRLAAGKTAAGKSWKSSSNKLKMASISFGPRAAMALSVILVSLICRAQPAAKPTQLDDYRRFALSQPANAERGKALFFDETRLACSKCHTLDGTGRKAGPDLFAIGDKFARPALIEAVLQPSANIAVGFGTTVVILKSGEEYTGVLQTIDNAGLDLMGADGKSMHFASTDIKERKPSPVSLMPEGLQSALSRNEFPDLIEFLSSLRQPESARIIDESMPAVIPALATPVKITPLFHEKFSTPRIDDVESGLTGCVEIPGQSNAWLVTHQIGLIWLIEKTSSGEKKSLFRDQVSETYSKTGPNGLLGITFHPKFNENRKYYLKYQIFENGGIATVIVERKMASDFRGDSEGPGRRLIRIPSLAGDHGGGCVEFGPDGFLYFAMGDSGPHRDPNGNAQNMQLLLGKMIRIDVDHAEDGRPYAIPKGNPFVGKPDVRPEIWSLGLRNPWRFSFDPKTGDLWLADVGQDRIDEVDLIHAGDNHGWNIFEGFERFSDQYRREGVKYTPPVFAYRRKYGNSVTGGFVYRGGAAASFEGVYIFGDFTSRRLFGLKLKEGKLERVRQIGTCPERIVSFARDERGGICVVGFEGTIYKLDFAEARFDGPIGEE